MTVENVQLTTLNQITAAKAPPTDSQQPSSNQLSTWPWFERTVIELPVEDAKGTGRSDAVLRGPFANLALNYNPFTRHDFRGPERETKICRIAPLRLDLKCRLLVAFIL